MSLPESEDLLSRLTEQKALWIVEAVCNDDWRVLRSAGSRLGVSAAEAENLIGCVIRARRRGELLGPQPISKPLTTTPLIAWRADISIASLGFGPALLWRLNLPNGRQITLQLSLRQFHHLRYNLAVLLKEMFALKNNPICSK